MHKYQDKIKVGNTLPVLELLLIVGSILLLAFLFPPSKLTEIGVEIGRKIATF